MTQKPRVYHLSECSIYIKEIWLSRKVRQRCKTLSGWDRLFTSGREELRSHQCFSFCVSSPRPAWRCSHVGTSSCACQAYIRWLRRTPAPPWPVTTNKRRNKTHNKLGLPSVCVVAHCEPSNGCSNVPIILPTLLAVFTDL